jgi:ribonuclease G
MNPRVTAQFTGDQARVLHQLESETGKVFFFEGSEGLPLDHFEVVETGKADEIAERAVPFAAGDEVKVQIVEPHMYNVDDAVAKIDGYIISVTGGGRLVGSKVLVRIDEAGRTSARATVIGEPEGGAPAGADSGSGEGADDAVDSTPRRRGRRGGRRRSPAKAATTEQPSK